MPDYGHPLQLGTFITPTAADPHAPVALAQVTEAAGLDLVTFQDHPYQPAFLDTWTLLSYVAAATERVSLAGNVLNLPLRPPAVLARAVASLDRLSGGRVELGLGAGGFWDPIVAMGGPRRTPGESVVALEEAIDIIRGIWDVDGSGVLRIDGAHYRLDGAKRGPARVHDVGIWLGAYKPRMLRLVGRKADGWLPSLGYMKDGDLAQGNTVIDEAAQEAGRDPREIRRLLNISGRFAARGGGFLQGPPEQWVSELLPLVLDDGVGTLILAADDAATIELFGAEVAPALREAVAAERAVAGVATGPVVTAAARAARRDGIDYDAVPASLAERAVEPGHVGYGALRSTYMRGGRPGLVLRPRTPSEVADAVLFAREQPVPLSIRSGGHGISGRSTNDGGIVIDLVDMAAIEVLDVAERRVRVEAGARWGEVAAAIAPHGWAISSGDTGGVGVGGLATAGGIGWLVREHGLTIDHVLAADVVLADGSQVRASATENPELFWGVRGAGSALGVVTAFEIEASEVGPIGFAQLTYVAGSPDAGSVADAERDVADFLVRWGATVEASPRAVTSFLIMGRPRAGQPAVAQVLVAVDRSEPDDVLELLQPFAAIAPLVDQSVQIVPYDALVTAPAGRGSNEGEPRSRSMLVDHLTPEVAADAARLILSGATYFFQIRSVGGAVADVDPDATAYAHREANFSVLAFGAGRTLDEAWEPMRAHSRGLYLSFETGLDESRAGEVYPPRTLARLRALKRDVDPGNVFRDNAPISPA